MFFYKKLLFFALILYTFLLHSQNIPEFIQKAKRPDNFIPKGWDILIKTKGDVNKDTIDDVVMVLKNLEEDQSDTNEFKRILLIITGSKDKMLNYFLSTEKVILCKHCGGVLGDPFQILEIKGGTIEVGHYGGSVDRWGISNFYKWDGRDFILVKEIRSSANANDPENTFQEKIKTVADFGKKKLRDFVISND